jgi:hypothetical protein
MSRHLGSGASRGRASPLFLSFQWLAHAEAARGAYVDKLLARRLVLAEVLPAITAFSKLFGLSS